MKVFHAVIVVGLISSVLQESGFAQDKADVPQLNKENELLKKENDLLKKGS